jgi:UDP-N-acetylglucosamine transferase subunit ALG13
MMIFVTAGTQLPFDRLVKTIDNLASEFKDARFVVQALKAKYTPVNVETFGWVTSVEFDEYIAEADLIISHAGTGTIISALLNKKPIIVMPRLTKYNEHRNDHQLATSTQMDKLNYIYVAYDEAELTNMFRRMWPNGLSICKTITNEASHEIMNSLNKFIKY